MPRMYTSGHVAKICWVPRWKLAYLIERKVLPEPRCVVPGRRLFSESEVKQIKEIFDSQPELRGKTAPGESQD